MAQAASPNQQSALIKLPISNTCHLGKLKGAATCLTVVHDDDGADTTD
jgi:hypothetical protein